MRLVDKDRHDETALTVRWMWLPVFIGQNAVLLAELDKALEQAFPPPVKLFKSTLDEMHEFSVNWLSNKLGITGLREYLSAIKNVVEREEDDE